jgi:hypothetical protein
MGKAGQLLIGHDYFGDGYGAERDELKSHPEIVAHMRRDWFMFKDRILADPNNQQIIDHERKMYGCVWAEWKFENAPRQNEFEPVMYELKRETR